MRTCWSDDMADLSLREELADIAADEPGSGKYRGMYDLIVREGRPYTPAEVPPELRRRAARTPHKCFQRCFDVAGEGDWTYVEGIAIDPGGVWFPVHHAWVTKDGMTAVDLARPFDPEREYVGIAIENVSLAKAAVRTGIIGSFLGDPDIYRSGLGPDTLTPLIYG